MGRAFFVVIAAISQLERDLICERVRNGLANAKAKGIHIGRKKQRNSALIRALLTKGVPYRSAAATAAAPLSQHPASAVAHVSETGKTESEEKQAYEQRLQDLAGKGLFIPGVSSSR